MGSQEKHIAVFGGTFNPIHKGHLAAAKSAADICGIEKIWFVPSFLPPHRDLAGKTRAIHRFEMVRLACEEDGRFFPSEFEIRRRKVSYTIDTLQHFIGTSPADTRISFLIGTDAFAETDTWFRIHDLFEMAGFLVMARPGTNITLKEALPEKLVCLFSNVLDDSLMHKSGKTVKLVKIQGIDMSSSGIRRLIKKKQDVSGLVPKSVADYISKHGLYL